jgi:hypothetical protein
MVEPRCIRERWQQQQERRGDGARAPVFEEPSNTPLDPGEPPVRVSAVRAPALRELEHHLREQYLREPAPEAPHRLGQNMGGNRRAPVKFKFNSQHEYTIVKGMYSRMIRNLSESILMWGRTL